MIQDIFTPHEDWLTKYILSQAEARGLASDVEAHGVGGCVPVGGVSKALADTVSFCERMECEFPVADDMLSDPIKLFAFEVSRRHRERGTELSMFVRLLSLIREAYLALVESDLVDDEAKGAGRIFVTRFFDRFETSLCVDWAKAEEREQRALEEEAQRGLEKEKERFLALFENLTKPVFVLDNDWCIETMNTAAANLLGGDKLPENLRYALISSCTKPKGGALVKVVLDDAMPWLAEAMGLSCSFREEQQDCQFTAVGLLHDGERHFDVNVSSMTAASIGFTGLTLVLDDVTFRANMERRLEDERNRANHYLDIVGSIIVVLDPSGSILRINRAGCDVLGYGEGELLGQNWIDLIVPEELRDEVKDYFYMIFAGDQDLDRHHVNYVSTKSGEDRLISWNNRLLRNDNGVPIGVLSSGSDITEKNAIEEALAEKELWLRNTFVALGEAVLIVSPDGVIIDANPAAEPMFGMSNEEISDINIRDLQVDEARHAEFMEKASCALDRGETAAFEFSMQRKDGTVFPTENTISRITGDDGTVLGSVFVMRDISNRKKAEMVLRNSEEKFRRIFETMGEGFMVTNLDGIIQMVNPATCALLGYEASEVVGQSMDLLYSDSSERLRLRQALKKGGTVTNMHLKAAHKSGAVLIVEANAHMVIDDDGTPIAMEGTFRDITARQEAERVLRDREKQYRAFFENNHAIMLLEDPKSGTIVDANPAASNFYGYSVEEMRGMATSEIRGLSEEDIYKEMFNARNEGRAYFLLQDKLKNGDIRDVEVYSGPIFVKGSQLLYSVIHDVTKRIKLEGEMKRMATTDALTGASNRHQFFQLARLELQRFLRYEHPLSAIMLDIDYFKNINDTHGHQAGDVVLRLLSALAQKTLRESDIFGRLGGEEFAALLPETGIVSAMQVAERLREKLSELVVREKDEDIRFTVSIGVTAANKHDKAIEDVLNRADEALYKAKRSGRNRVEQG